MARSRRSRGTGCYDKCNGYYRWRIGVHDPLTGKTRYKAIKAKTRAALDAKVTAYQEEHGAGEPPPVVGKRLTVRQWVERWLAGLENKIAQSTLVRYRHNAERHLLPRFGSMWVGKVSPLELQDYFDELSKTLAPAAVATIRAHFRACFAKAVRYGVLSKNPVMQTDPPKCQKPELKILEDSDVERILTVTKNKSYRSPARDDTDDYVIRRNYLIILLAVSSGMRQGEILGLTWSCVHGNTIEVERSLQALPGDKRTLKSPKNGKARTVAIPASVARELEVWREYQAQYADTCKGLFNNPLSLVFTAPMEACVDGGHFTYHHFRVICKAAGIEGARFHDLRHYWASSALSRGASVMAVSEQLGHSSINITLDRYTQVLQRSKDELREMLDSNPLFL